MIGKRILQFMVFTAWISVVQAAEAKDLQFESVPSGAEVYLLQGTRQEFLGTTPLKYEAEFHSEMSILRFALKKSGHKAQTVEVNAQQDRVVVKLTSQGFAANPSAINDPILRSLQERLAPTIDRTLPKLLAARSPYEFDLAGPVRVTRLDDKILLILPIELGKPKDKISPTAQGQNEVFLKMLWDQFGQNMVIPLAKAVRSERLLNGIVLDLGYSLVRHGFEVGSHMESRTEMQCVPGTEMRSIYNYCLTMRGTTCVGGLEMQPVYDPCLTKVPVKYMEWKADPKATTVSIKSRARYVFPIELIELAGEQDKVFSQLGIQMTNERGEIVIKRGFIPSSFTENP
jgi:hypothetical protein